MSENRDALLDQGYNALQSCRFQDAKEIFETLRQEEPQGGLILLGAFMAERQIRGRNELARHWQQIREDPNFRLALQDAPSDFLPWLDRDMASLQNQAAPQSPSHQVSAASAETDFFQKILYTFTGILIFLFVLVIFFVYRTFPENDNPLSFLMSSFAVATLISGGTVILMPIYGWVLMTCGRFRKALKIFFSLIAGIGFPSTALLAIVYCYSLGDTSYEAVYDRYTFFAFFTAACIHLLGLIFPRILDRIRPSR